MAAKKPTTTDGRILSGVAHQLVQEITYMNDEGWYNETPDQRWARMRKWVAAQIMGTV